MYSGVKISEVVESNKGIGGVMALLWFQVITIHVNLMVLLSKQKVICTVSNQYGFLFVLERASRLFL